MDDIILESLLKQLLDSEWAMTMTVEQHSPRRTGYATDKEPAISSWANGPRAAVDLAPG